MIPETGILGMMLGATLGVQLVLGLLVLMSLWSWTIIFTKVILYKRTRRQVTQGYTLFNDAPDLSEGLQAVSRDGNTALSRVGLLAVGEFRKLEKAEIDRERKRMLVKDTLRRVLRQGVNEEMKRLSSSLSFLATCANAAPFIGLFGTVWGIKHSFEQIAISQNTNLAVVAPGIAEALLATGVGLVAAIPAVVFYNKLNADSERIVGGYEGFADEFATILSRQLDS